MTRWITPLLLVALTACANTSADDDTFDLSDTGSTTDDTGGTTDDTGGTTDDTGGTTDDTGGTSDDDTGGTTDDDTGSTEPEDVEGWSIRVPFDGSADEENGAITVDTSLSTNLGYVAGQDGTNPGALAESACAVHSANFGRRGAMTMSMWVRPSETWDRNAEGRRYIAQFDNGSWQVYYSFGRLVVEVYTNSPRTLVELSKERTLTGGQWHHVAWTVSNEAGFGVLYVDGVPEIDAQFPTDNEVQGFNGSMLWGCNLVSGRSMNSAVAIDDVRIYNRELTDTEVGTLAGL